MIVKSYELNKINLKRNIINTNLNMDEKTLINEIKNNSITNKFLKDKNISRVIHIKNKLINLIIK